MRFSAFCFVSCWLSDRKDIGQIKHVSLIPKDSLPDHVEEEDREGTSFQTMWTNRIER